MKQLIVALALLSTVGAQAQKMTPIQLNDRLATITDSLYKGGQGWGTELGKIAGSTKDFKQLSPYRANLQKYIIEQKAYVSKLPDNHGSKPLQNAMISFLDFEYRMINEGFMPFEKLSNTATDEDLKGAMATLTTAATEEGEQLKKINVEQVAYGKKNGFKIESPKTSDSDTAPSGN